MRMRTRNLAYIGGSMLCAALLAGVVSTVASRGPDGPARSAPKAPGITEPSVEGQVVSAADVHMETEPFQDADPGSTHLCTDWEIWTVEPAVRVWFASCIEGVRKAHVHLGDGVFENSYAGRTELLADNAYELRVRHRDSSGDAATEWSAYSVRHFRTDKQRKPLAGAPQWRVTQRGYVVEEVASGFQLPVNIAMAPSRHSADPARPLFYVSELYGQIKVVRGDYKVSTYAKGLLNFDPTGKFPGTGETGVTGIVVEPTSGDVIAALVYESGGKHYPRVVRFHSTDGGFTTSSRKTVLDMRGEQQEAAHQVSNLSIGPDGKLYVHMGDGFVPSAAKDLNTFRGKILRVNLDGSAPSDNPFYNAGDGISARDYVFAYGLRNPFGGAWRAADGSYYEVENGAKTDRLARITKGTDYGWNGDRSSMTKRALYLWSPSHAPVNITFVEPETGRTAGFPKDKYGHAFVSESGPTYASGPQDLGKRIVEFSFNADGSMSRPKTLMEYNGIGKSSVVGLAAGADGLYFTSLWPDAETVDPSQPGAKIYRVRHVQPSGGHPHQ